MVIILWAILCVLWVVSYARYVRGMMAWNKGTLSAADYGRVRTDYVYSWVTGFSMLAGTVCMVVAA